MTIYHDIIDSCVCQVFILRCFWSAFVCVALVFCQNTYSQAQQAKAAYLSLSNTTVDIVYVEHDACCIPGPFIPSVYLQFTLCFNIIDDVYRLL